jgi:ATP-dependent RNA helicase RhlE
MNFEELGLSEPILRAIFTSGYTDPTPIQLEAIPHVMQGRDVLGCAQTGTGKTAAFALPILHRLTDKPPVKGGGRNIRVLVLSPTRELASQIATNFRNYGKHTTLRQTTVFGGVSQHMQVRDLERGVDILVATPGRLLDLKEQGFIDLRHVETLIIDEADRMFDMGFMPDLRRIIGFLPKERQTLLFSATMVPEVEQLANAVLNSPVQIRIAPVKKTDALIEQSVCPVPNNGKIHLLKHILGREEVTQAIVFTRTKHGADKVVRRLEESGFRAAAIHGNKSQNARERALAAFKSRRISILVATDVAARGIDIDGISHVFNFDLPEDPQTYVHRIGRTGRAGATGVAIAFCDNEERRMLRDIERLVRRALPLFEIPADVWEQISAQANEKAPKSQMANDRRRDQPENDRRREYPAADRRREQPMQDRRREQPATEKRRAIRDSRFRDQRGETAVPEGENVNALRHDAPHTAPSGEPRRFESPIGEQRGFEPRGFEPRGTETGTGNRFAKRQRKSRFKPAGGRGPDSRGNGTAPVAHSNSASARHRLESGASAGQGRPHFNKARKHRSHKAAAKN